jgi:SAM-dependent methyltransferase
MADAPAKHHLASVRARAGQALPRSFRRLLGRLRRLKDRRRSRREVWWRSLGDELGYWTLWIERRGDSRRDRVTDSFEWRVDPHSEVQPPLREVVARIGGEVVSILDVGAGPLTSVGKVCPGKKLEIVAIDPLAREYDRLLGHAGITPPVRTLPGEAEEVLERFEPESFDVAYSDNALDHTADPLRAIESMLAVVKPEGSVVLRHGLNEGERNFYLGLHQWNFDLHGSDLIVWSPRTHHNISQVLRRRATVECNRQGRDVVCVIGKHPG